MEATFRGDLADAAFNQFTADFGRTYTGAERSYRHGVFTATKAMIDQHNSEKGHTYTCVGTGYVAALSPLCAAPTRCVLTRRCPPRSLILQPGHQPLF